MLKSLLPIALVIVAASSFAGQAGARTPNRAPKKIKCPVMGGVEVDIAFATKNRMYTDYKGNRYFFCCSGCPDTFKAAPAKYAKAPHIKTPKKKAG